MPNHFHILLKQETENGTFVYMSRVINSYVKYINTKHKRVGPLFQGVFKAVLVETDEQLLHLSRYIHMNAYASGIVSEKSLFSYPWSSLSAYCNDQPSFVDKTFILSNFRSISDYKKFISDQTNYAKELEAIKHLILEET